MNKDKRAELLHTWGWYLFIISAGFFITSSVRNGDMFGFLGSLFFLIACFFFLVPSHSQVDDG